ncbi:MAG: hypothetical protein SW833_08830 [Cyanobacteriota bacterium]|nr:hypothetical protein [Cyanobacteriota bacterium]
MFKQLQIKKALLNLSLGLGLVLIVGLFQIPVRAQITLATVQEIIDGDRVFIEQTLAKVNDTADFQQTIATEDARASLLFDDSAVGRMGPNTTLVVGQCIELKEGLLLASGPANGCTTTFEVGVQGTTYAMAVDEEGNANVKVLEGEVQLKPMDGQNAIALSQGEQIDISPQGIFSTILDISQGEIETLLQGALFDGFQVALPQAGKLQQALRELYPTLDLPNLPGFNVPSLPIPRPRGFPF